MKLHMINAGPLTTVQDRGRFGYMEFGITTSGVMDKRAYELANALVGNKGDEAVLEATLMGPTIEFEGDGIIAFSGAVVSARLDQEQVERNQPVYVKSGQVLTFGMATKGVRIYIAASGGIDVPLVMDSRSTNLKCSLGGLEGRKLQAKDVLCTGEADFEKAKKRAEKNANKIAKNPEKFYPESFGEEHAIPIRVVLGPQEEYFTKQGMDTFLQAEYTVSSESDRMGIRLDGAVIEGVGAMDIVSDGITFGSIQVTSKGLPIVLMADHQTTGGYAKIATVIQEDLSLLAQARPGVKVHFQQVFLEEIQRRNLFL